MNGLLRLLTAVVGRLPWRAVGTIGAALGWIAGSVLRIRRAHVEASMLAAGFERPAPSARAMYRSLGISAAELLWLGAPRNASRRARATLDAASAQAWQSALAQGRGVVIAASHTGNWDLAACAVAERVELLVVTKRLQIQSLDRFWRSTRLARGVKLVGARGALQRAREVLGKKGAVAMVIDQVPDERRHAVAVPFLGQRALVDRSPAALAAARRAPLVVAASRRDERGQHVLHVLSLQIPPETPAARRAWVYEATVAATRALDAFVRAHPDQWLWLHRRWKRLDPVRREATLADPCTIPSSSPGAASKVA
jgi:KDO2-lipid IV(A) lauroyltransferase